MRVIPAKDRASSRKVSHTAPRSSEDLIALLLKSKAPRDSGLSRRWGADEFFYLGSGATWVSVQQLQSGAQPWRVKGVAVASGSTGFT